MIKVPEIPPEGSDRDPEKTETIATHELQDTPQPRRNPAFNAPAAVVWLGFAFVGIQALMSLLPDRWTFEILLRAAFIPLRYSDVSGAPGGLFSALLSPITYAFLHGGWVHVLTNTIWMLAFGSAVAWRFGTTRFLLFSAICAAAGAAMHFGFFQNSIAPVVGASAAVSGQMAAASRFVFSGRGGLMRSRQGGAAAFQQPAQPLRDLLKNGSALAFVGIWFAVNYLFGLAASDSFTGGAQIAWQAHIGGFVAGFFLFPLFDPVRRSRISPQ